MAAAIKRIQSEQLMLMLTLFWGVSSTDSTDSSTANSYILNLEPAVNLLQACNDSCDLQILKQHNVEIECNTTVMNSDPSPVFVSCNADANYKQNSLHCNNVVC